VDQDLDQAARDLSDAITRYVRAAVAMAVRPGDVYSTHALPPDVRSRRRFHELAKGIPSAVKRGRAWIVPQADWHARRQPPSAVASDACADAFIAAAGYRPTRAA
jgi:hypothetical protein